MLFLNFTKACPPFPSLPNSHSKQYNSSHLSSSKPHPHPFFPNYRSFSIPSPLFPKSPPSSSHHGPNRNRRVLHRLIQQLSQTREKEKAAQHCGAQGENGLRGLRTQGQECPLFHERSEVCGHKHEAAEGDGDRLCGAKQGAEESSGDREENRALALCALRPRKSPLRGSGLR